MAKKSTNQRKSRTSPKKTRSPQYYYKQGLTKAGHYEHEGAIGDFNKAIRLKPDFAEAYYHRGISKFELVEYEDAIADINDAIKYNPDYFQAYAKRGEIRSLMRRRKKGSQTVILPLVLIQIMMKHTLSVA